MEGGAAAPDGAPAVPEGGALALPDRWILSRLAALEESVEASLLAYRFDEMANSLYQFVWHEYCDWYVEMCKPALLSGAGDADRARTRAVLLHVLESSLRLLHPVMPFLTEEIWQRLPHAGATIALAPYPRAEAGRRDLEAEREVTLLMEVVGRVRNMRAELNIDPGKRVRLVFQSHLPEAGDLVRRQSALLSNLARLEDVREVAGLDAIGPAARAVAAGLDLALPVGDLLDLAGEEKRLERDIEKLRAERASHLRKLDNADFIGRARPEVVEKTRRIASELGEKLERLERTLSGLRSGPTP
jgi:valyl-tRNA synthetase